MIRSKKESFHVNQLPRHRESTNLRGYGYKARRDRGLSTGPVVRWLAIGVILLAITPGNSVGQSTPPTDPTPSQIVQFLSQTIDWYRQTQQEQHIATEPGDLGFVADNRRMAAQVVRLAFEFARAEEQQQAKPSKANAAVTPTGSVSQYESMSRAAARADQLVQETQAELESLQHSLETAPPAKRRHLQTQIAELQSEIGLFQARQQALHNILDFASGASGAGGAASLRAQIEELARAVPPAVSGTSVNEPGSATDQQPAAKAGETINKPSPTGMWALIADLFRLSSKRTVLSNDLRVTQTLENSSKQLRAPLVAHLKQLIQNGDQLAKQADTSDQNALAQVKQ